MSDTLLIQLQTDIAERLRADEVLGPLGNAIVTERVGSIAEEVNRHLGLVLGGGGRRGLCLVVLQLTGNIDSPNLPFPTLELRPAVRILENPVQNNTGLAALTAARRVARVLHHYTPFGLTSLLIGTNPVIVGVEDPIAPVAYEAQFSCREASFDTIQKVHDPVLSPKTGAPPQAVTITCGTSGAQIYVTLDGSHPSPGNPAAILYAGPITVTEDGMLRAVAYAEGLIASNASSAYFEA